MILQLKDRAAKQMDGASHANPNWRATLQAPRDSATEVVMGEVLDLARYCVEGMPATGRQRRSRRLRQDAQIVFFPGVRVERHTVDLAARFVDVAGRIAGVVRENDSGRRV